MAAAVSQALGDAFQRVDFSRKENQIVVVIGVGAAAALTYFALAPSTGYKKKPSTFELSGGTIAKKEIKAKFDDYSQSYGSAAGEGIKESERGRTAQLVDTFYNLVTDIYEWGWGQSFHFSPRLPGKSLECSEAAHEARLAALLKLAPGKKCLDVGCGVGGPMRTIASTSGAHVTGITINDYQVERATYHNNKLGLQELCQPVQGNFLEMPFADGTFDAAYAIEATCHAPKLESVYGEIHRVLKPGGLFATYEWVATKSFDEKDPEHVRIIDEINYGNGLPEMRTYKQAEDAGQAVGFKLVASYDIATASPVTGPWYGRLKWLKNGKIIVINKFLVDTSSALGLAPRGMKQVHDMLVNVATSLIQGGESGIFSPMHLLVFEKPDGSAAVQTTPAAADVPRASAPATPPVNATAPSSAAKPAAATPTSSLSPAAAPFDPMSKPVGKGKKGGKNAPAATSAPTASH